MSTKSLGPNAFKYDKVLSLSRQASDEMWELRRLTASPWLGSVKVGGVLSFGPTLISDVINNYNHNARLDQKFNYKQFAVDSATNQTGNLISVAGGATAMAGGGAAGIPSGKGNAVQPKDQAIRLFAAKKNAPKATSEGTKYSDRLIAYLKNLEFSGRKMAETLTVTSDDYEKMKAAALRKKEDEILSKWFLTAKEDVYIDIDPAYDSCNALDGK